jgi:hypothetical protein
MMNEEEVIMPYFKEILWHSPQGPEENNGKYQ